MINSKVVLVALLLAIGALGTLNVKENVYNVTEENFEEFMEFSRGKNATFYIKFYSRKDDSLTRSHVPTLSDA